MGFVEVLTLIFVVAKIMGFISWSWWLVLLPEVVMCFIYIILLTSPLWLDSLIERHFDKKAKKRIKESQERNEQRRKNRGGKDV